MLKTARGPDPPTLKGSSEIGRTPGKGVQSQGQPLYKEQMSRQLFSQVKLQMEEEDRGLRSHECHNAGSLTASATRELRATKGRNPAENKQQGILTQPEAGLQTSSAPGQRLWRLQ